MSYIRNEIIIGNGTETEFTLGQNFRNGTCRIEYNGRLFYEYREVSPNKLKFDFAPTAEDKVKVSFYTVSDAGHLNAVRYVTPKQVLENMSGDNGGGQLPTEEDIEKQIRLAEKFIDGFCGFWEKADPKQQLLFPRTDDIDLEDNYPAIPKEITAAIMFVLNIIRDDHGGYNEQIIEESIGNYSYKKQISSDEKETIDDQLMPVKIMLKGFRKLTGKMNINL